MPWLERRGASFRIKFRYARKSLSVPLKTADESEATNLLGRFEDNLRLLRRGVLVLPPGADAGLFLLSDGKLDGKAATTAPRTIESLFTLYQKEITPGSKEANTRKCEDIHLAHLKKLLKPRTPLAQVTTAVLQTYIDRRARDKCRARHIKPQTIKKELATFLAIWNWGHKREHAPPPCSLAGLTFPRQGTKHKFRTYEEVKAIVDRGGLKEYEVRELWDGLFLNTAQVAEVLACVKTAAVAEWVYPFFVAAAHTGARRSELLRARVEDFDFDNRLVTLREKKKSRTSDTHRTVDMTELLEGVMRDYFSNGHPGGGYAFSAEANSLLTDSVTQKTFRRALRGSKWVILRGYHTFRHSFASNLAAAGIDQRVIAALMGHMTVEMQSRYRHLFPSQRRAAVASVYAGPTGGSFTGEAEAPRGGSERARPD